MMIVRFAPRSRATAAAMLLAAACLPAGAAEAPQWRDGKQLYDKLCGHCHKPSVGVGPLLEGRELPLEYLKVIVRNGLNAMPAFPESHVDDDALAKLGGYLATLTPPTPGPEAKP